MSKKYRWTGLFGLILGIAIAFLFLFFLEVQKQLEIQEKRGECIAYYVSLGIERADIKTSGSDCWIETE